MTAPEGRLPKPAHELKGYAKTKELSPGESETLSIRIPTESLASYDEEKAAFLLEAGSYLFCLGEHSRSTARSQTRPSPSGRCGRSTGRALRSASARQTP